MFGEGKPEAKWCIQNRTYVDGCMAGDNNLTSCCGYLRIWMNWWNKEASNSKKLT
jgi:hypothetical protein